jgi:hypothetical protein
MNRSGCKQYAFKVDLEERSAFNSAVIANGKSAANEIRRMVEDYLLDQSRYRTIASLFKASGAQAFINQEVRINAYLDETSLRRLSVSCQYANITVNHMLRAMIVAYVKHDLLLGTERYPRNHTRTS